MMGPRVAPEGEVKVSIPGAGGGWGPGAWLRAALALPARPVLPQPKACFGRIFSLDQALFLFFFFLGTGDRQIHFAVTAKGRQSVCYRPACKSLFVACC